MNSDWVNVRLTPGGAALAGAGQLVVAGSRYQFRFRAGTAVRVTRADWLVILRHMRRDGALLFEVAEADVQSGNMEWAK